jgi:hypothetical protein
VYSFLFLAVINRFHFYERCALRPRIYIAEHIFKRGETLVKVKKPQFLPTLKGRGFLEGNQ